MSLKQILLNEYSYDGNMGFEEMMKFYGNAPDDLIKKVDRLINDGNDKEAWKVIQKFLNVKLKGDGFN